MCKGSAIFKLDGKLQDNLEIGLKKRIVTLGPSCTICTVTVLRTRNTLTVKWHANKKRDNTSNS